MKYDILLRKSLPMLLLLFVLVACAGVAVAQTANNAEPARRERLLNGLKLLVWNEPAGQNVIVRLRVHAGSAFDPKDEEGTMRLLADILFPDQNVKNYFAEELGGTLAAEATYDYLEITATGKADEFVRILDTVRLAVTNTEITPDNLKKIKTAYLERIETENQNLANAADAAVRRRLYGDFFPYGRIANGSAASVGKIDHLDLIDARNRLVTADNATLAISGNVNPAYAVRAAKQLFGAWKKADKPLLSTFRQPDAVNAETLFVRLPNVETAQIRFAVRGTARNAADFAAANLAARILQERWRKVLPAEISQNAFVRHETHVLPGIVIFGASVGGGFAESRIEAARQAFAKILSEPVTADEFNRAKTDALADFKSDAILNYLDADTFKITKNAKSADQFNALVAADAQTVIAGWQKQTSAAVAVSQAEANTPK